jgi:hypothetical protein
MATTTAINHSISPALSSSFSLKSEPHTIGVARFAITFITERCVVVESAWLTTSQACRSRASAEKFCELAAPYITRKIANWVTVTLARMIAALDLTPPTDDTPAAMPLVRQQVSVAACGRGATSPEDSHTIRMQQQIVALSGVSTGNPNDSWQALMDKHLAAKSTPQKETTVSNETKPVKLTARQRLISEATRLLSKDGSRKAIDNAAAHDALEGVVSTNRGSDMERYYLSITDRALGKLIRETAEKGRNRHSALIEMLSYPRW